MYHYVSEGGQKIAGFADSHPLCLSSFADKKPVKLFMEFSAKYGNWTIKNPGRERAQRRANHFELSEDGWKSITDRIEALEAAVFKD